MVFDKKNFPFVNFTKNFVIKDWPLDDLELKYKDYDWAANQAH
jgi:uncharacterized linocin/CFP29 family protein